ncbi:CBASS cGAMP-activated phospholipase [Brevibacillus sp. NPDC003359]|uniref:CBASS cGAMP-activated phospholipase n=1 Tax=unclassified Brevibacillus TaxID=2684853 RepID=UPI003677C0F5
MTIDWEKVKKQGWERRDPSSFKILSIDGGGIRGIYPANFIAKVEDKIGDRSHRYFDLIAGTSTGGIIAIALSLGISAQEIVDLYVEKGKSIFKKRLLSSRMGLIRSKYSNKNLIKELQQTFGENRIKDAKTLLCVPAVEHWKAKPKVYKTPHSSQFWIDGEKYAWEAAQATSAAPYYFQAASFEKECKLDGGLWANNPITLAIAEAVNMGVPIEDIKVLSLGTGQNVYDGRNWLAKVGGGIPWNKRLLDVILESQATGALFTAQYLLPKENLKRVNFTSEKQIPLDAVNKKDMDILLREAEHSFQETFIKEGIVEFFDKGKKETNALVGY